MVEGAGIWEISVPSPEFSCELKTAQKKFQKASMDSKYYLQNCQSDLTFPWLTFLWDILIFQH